MLGRSLWSCLPFLMEDGFLGRCVGKESVVLSKKARRGWLVLSAVESCLFFAIWGCWGPGFTEAGLPGPPLLQLTYFPGDTQGPHLPPSLLESHMESVWQLMVSGSTGRGKLLRCCGHCPGRSSAQGALCQSSMDKWPCVSLP